VRTRLRYARLVKATSPVGQERRPRNEGPWGAGLTSPRRAGESEGKAVLGGQKSQSETALLPPEHRAARRDRSNVTRRGTQNLVTVARLGGLPGAGLLQHHSRPTLLIGTGARAEFAAREVAAARNGFSIIGLVTGMDKPGDPLLSEYPVLGTPDDLEGVVRRTGARAVVVAQDDAVSYELARLLEICREQGTEVLDVVELIESLAGRVPISCVRSTWLRDTLAERSPSAAYHAVKRGLDLVIACMALLLLLPLFPFLALAIWRSTGGSPLFVQERVGLGGRIIRIYKLRSMVCNAEHAGRPVWAEDGDQRITRLGRLLRKTRLDEVPQFANVLAGEMSVVGPRPERPYFVNQLRRDVAHFEWRHVVRPGITGWAQVKQGYAASAEESLVKLEHDLYYIKHRSLSLEFRILWKTVAVVLGRRGAR